MMNVFNFTTQLTANYKGIFINTLCHYIAVSCHLPDNMDSLIATARSNKVATYLGIQDFSQLRKDYGRERADVIINIAGYFEMQP